jgi:hypothetical protein
LLARLGVAAGWCGAAFAVETAFAMALMGGIGSSVAVIYALGLAATFPLHEKTRGTWLLVVAFGLGFALFAEGVAFAIDAQEVALGRRFAFAALLALPLLALVVRRRATGEEDAPFARHARPVVAASLALALPLFVAGMAGSHRADPAPYERARRALDYSPLQTLLLEGFSFDRAANGKRCWSALESSWTGIAAPIRLELQRACEALVARDPWGACACADELLASRSRTLRERRDAYRHVASASALPWAIAALFTWRGRRRRPGVHARDGMSDG